MLFGAISITTGAFIYAFNNTSPITLVNKQMLLHYGAGYNVRRMRFTEKADTTYFLFLVEDSSEN